MRQKNYLESHAELVQVPCTSIQHSFTILLLTALLNQMLVLLILCQFTESLMVSAMQ